MGLLKRIKSLFKPENEVELEDFKERIKRKYGFMDFIYVTNEGLPILGTFSNCEEFSAKVPELLKILSQFVLSEHYIIITEGSVYNIIVINKEVVFIGTSTRPLSKERIEKLVNETKRELNI